MRKRFALALSALLLFADLASAGPLRDALRRWRENRPVRFVIAASLHLPGTGYGPRDAPPAIYGGPGTRR